MSISSTLCGCCLQTNIPLAEKFCEPQFEDIHDHKYVTILRHIFPDIIFDERNGFYLCSQCSALLHGAHVLRTALLNNQEQYSNYLNTLFSKVDLNEECENEEYENATRQQHEPIIFNCTQCDKSFSKINFLKNHLKAHGMENHKICQHCGRIYKSNKYLMVHMRVHTGEKPFKCMFCNMAFRHYQTWKTHENNCGKEGLQHNEDNEMNQNEEISQVDDIPVTKKEGGYSCNMCNRVFAYEGHMLMHRKAHFRQNKLRLQEHLQTDKGISNAKKFIRRPIIMMPGGGHATRCRFCRKSFHNMQSLAMHEKMHKDELFKCRFCPMGFRIYNSMKKHETRKHPELLMQMSSSRRIRNVANKEFNQKEQDEMEDQMSPPPVEVFIEEGQLEVKMQEEDEEQPEIINQVQMVKTELDVNLMVEDAMKQEGQENFYEQQNFYHQKGFMCSFCPKRFRSRQNKAVHERVHTGEKPFKCPFCSSTFRQAVHLRTHLRTHRDRGETSPFKCSFCNDSFAHKPTLTIHERTMHGIVRSAEKLLPPASLTMSSSPSSSLLSNQSSHVCPYCDRHFSTRGTLAIHEQTHLQQSKPYRCTQCAINFRDRKKLDDHKRDMHGPLKRTGKIQCRRCPKVLNGEYQWRTHMEVHFRNKVVRCKICNKKFQNLTALQRHEVIHSDERPFKCTYCDSSFKRKDHQLVHEKIHRNKSGGYVDDVADKNVVLEAENNDGNETSTVEQRCYEINPELTSMIKIEIE